MIYGENKMSNYAQVTPILVESQKNVISQKRKMSSHTSEKCHLTQSTLRIVFLMHVGKHMFKLHWRRISKIVLQFTFLKHL